MLAMLCMVPCSRMLAMLCMVPCSRMVVRFVSVAHFAVRIEDFERGAFALPNRSDADERAQRIDDTSAFANDPSHVFGRDLQLDVDGVRVF